MRFLLAVGDSLIGWRLLAHADIAHVALCSGSTTTNDEAFYRGKIATAAFFAKNIAAEPDRIAVHHRVPRRRDHARSRGRVLTDFRERYTQHFHIGAAADTQLHRRG